MTFWNSAGGIVVIVIAIWLILPTGTISKVWFEFKLLISINKDYDWKALEDFRRAEIEYASCGEENPGRPGNYCELVEDHWAYDNGATSHRDGEDREWRGRDL